MLGPDVPVPVSPSLLRVRNGWLVSDGRTLVAVYAGAAGDDSSVGRVVVLRQDLVAGRQTVRTLDTGPTGALAITAAPLGSSVETSAQTGSIHLRTAGSRALRLDLASGTVGSG
jgi:sarcosine oxidase gamma subunit